MDNKIQYIYELVDKYSPVLEKMVKHQERLTDAAAKSEARAKSLEGQFEKMGKAAEKLGKQLTLKVTAPIVAFATLAVHEWNQQAAANAQVMSALASTNGRVGRTFEQLEAQANSLSQTRLFSDDAILAGATTQLLKFNNISGDTFDRAQKAALDYATRMKMDLSSAAQVLGKALNNPIRATRALNEAGIALTAQQQQQIKTLVQTGNIAKAQNMILSMIEARMGGAAEAAAQAGIGPALLAKQKFLDSLERLGEAIFKVLVKLVPYIDKVTAAINRLTPGQMKWIVITGMIVAAVGPLLVIVGSLAAALGFLATPAGLIIGLLVLLAAKVALVVYHWNNMMDKIKNSSVWQWIIQTVNWLTASINNLLGAISNLTNSPIGQTLSNAMAFASGGGVANLAGNIAVNLTAPKGSVKSVSASFANKGVNTGVNMRHTGDNE